jgi:hypothetical protein
LLVGQHLSMGDTAGDILRIKTIIKADAFGEKFDPFVHGNIKSTAATGTGQHAPQT